MKAFLCTIFCVGISVFAYSQNPVLIHETFDDNRNHWPVGTAVGDIKITQGKYFIRSQEKLIVARLQTAIDGRKDFSLETDLTVASSSLGDKVGFTFNNGETNTYLTLILSKTQESYVEGYVNEKYVYYTKSIYNPSINPFGKINKIKIEQKGPDLIFYANGTQLHTLKNKRIPGNNLGYEVRRNIVLSVDDLIIYQQVPEIKFTQGFTSEKREHLSRNVNSSQSEMGHIISADGKYLFVDRREDPNDIYDEYTCDDIWVSEKLSNGEWGPATKMPYPINDGHSNDIISISPDNNTLFMADTACGPTSQLRFFISNRTATGWTKPVSSSVMNGYNYSKYFCATVSSDGQFVVASITRSDSYGSSDLYMIRKINDRQWAEPVNLGNVINSFGYDEAPFLAADGKTIYFASNGHRGLGNYDIFVSKRLDDTWTNWSQPENLGPTVNSDKWDMYYRTDASAEYAYYITDSDDSYGGGDIYRIKLPKEAKPNPVVLIYGKVLNSKTQEPLESTITYEDLKTGKKIGEARSNPLNGEYKIVLPYGENYGYHASVKGFIAVSENLDLADPKEYSEMQKDLMLIPIEVGETIKLNNVFFEQGKETMLESSYSELNRLVEILKSNPTMEIELNGHTDNIGDQKLNLELSEKRVKVVKDYLVSKGISSSRISGKGFGGLKPVASNSKEETRKLNRRVEFVIIKK